MLDAAACKPSSGALKESEPSLEGSIKHSLPRVMLRKNQSEVPRVHSLLRGRHGLDHMCHKLMPRKA